MNILEQWDPGLESCSCYETFYGSPCSEALCDWPTANESITPNVPQIKLNISKDFCTVNWNGRRGSTTEGKGVAKARLVSPDASHVSSFIAMQYQAVLDLYSGYTRFKSRPSNLISPLRFLRISSPSLSLSVQWRQVVLFGLAYWQNYYMVVTNLSNGPQISWWIPKRDLL
jgi:hypothetical protein